ncbi:hypothetical protein NC652_014967 [Populus alba x Populus x berolinensis]|nr:hypothetical protein NC652_014967 [Populus alba x Populus x berolinensis]
MPFQVLLCSAHHFFPSIFLTSAWIQLHKDVIALTVYSWDSPSKVGESPDQSKAKLALVNPMAFLSLFLLCILVSLPRIAKALLDWRKLQKLTCISQSSAFQGLGGHD